MMSRIPFFNAVLRLIFVVFIGTPAMASSGGVGQLNPNGVYISSSIGYSSCPNQYCVQRESETFYISNATGELDSLIYDNGKIKEVIQGTTQLSQLFLFKGKYIVGLNKYNELYFLAPDIDDNNSEFHVVQTGVSFFKKYERIWHWVKIAENVLKVAIDKEDILVLYGGTWRFSTPTLYLFHSIEKNPKAKRFKDTIDYVRSQGGTISCGLGCSRGIGGIALANERSWVPPFDLLGLTTVQEFGYDSNGRIIVSLLDHPAPISLAAIKRNKAIFLEK